MVALEKDTCHWYSSTHHEKRLPDSKCVLSLILHVPSSPSRTTLTGLESSFPRRQKNGHASRVGSFGSRPRKRKSNRTMCRQHRDLARRHPRHKTDIKTSKSRFWTNFPSVAATLGVFETCTLRNNIDIVPSSGWPITFPTFRRKSWFLSELHLENVLPSDGIRQSRGVCRSWVPR